MTEQTDGRVRSYGPRTPEDDKTLFWAPIIMAAAVIMGGVGAVGQTVGWWTLFLAATATVVVAGLSVLSFIVKRNDQDEMLHQDGENTSLLARFGYDDADEITMAEELLGITVDRAEFRRLYGSPVQPTSVQVTEEEIDDVEAIMTFAEDETRGEAVEPPPPNKWRWLSVPFIWVLMLWPVYFWPRYFWQYLCQYPSVDATDRAEDWMWWIFFVAIPGIPLVGWNSEGSSIPFWLVLVFYAGSGLFLWAMLTFRRTTAT